MNKSPLREKLLSSDTKTLKRPMATVGASPYAPIYLSVLIPRERLSFNLYLKVAQMGSQDFGYLPFLAEGEAWERQMLELLTQKGIDRLYFLNEDLEKVIAYLNNHLQLLRHRSAKLSPELLTVFSEHMNLSIRRAFQAPRLGEAVEIAQGQVEALIERLQQDPGAMKMLWKVLYHDYNLYNHSINLCLLGTAFMLFLKKSAKESRDFGLAGLFHDVGMTHIPQEIIFKGRPLTPGEKEEISHHPAIGYRLLSHGPYMSHVPNEVSLLALEHHENADGSGYPLHLPLDRQHPWTRIIRLLDSYDSLTSNRPFHRSYKPFEAIKILQEDHGPRGPIYDLQTLKNFIRFLVPY